MPLLQSTQVHIPLLGQCCLFNRSASCLWLLSFLLNITGQIPSSHPPHSSAPSCLSFPADSSHKELLLTFLKCINCERLFSEPETPSARWRRSIAGCKLEVPGSGGPGAWPCMIESSRSRSSSGKLSQPTDCGWSWGQMWPLGFGASSTGQHSGRGGLKIIWVSSHLPLTPRPGCSLGPLTSGDEARCRARGQPHV